MLQTAASSLGIDASDGPLGEAEPEPPLRGEALTSRLVAAGRGDRDAFAAVFRAMLGPATRVAMSVLTDRAQAEEVAQEVLLEVWLKGRRFDPQQSSAYAWILMIARRRAVDRVRQAQQARLRDSRFLQDGPAGGDALDADVADVVLRQLTSVEVRARLADLTAVQREAITLAFYGGHSYAGVARLLQVPTPTVKTRIRDGLARLRGTLAEQTPCAEAV